MEGSFLFSFFGNNEQHKNINNITVEKWFHKAVHTLILITCAYITLHNKRDFAITIKFMNLEMAKILP